MKKMLFAIEFVFVFLIFLLPPLKASPQPQAEISMQEIKLTLFSLTMTFTCAMLFFFHRDIYKKKYIQSSKINIFVKHSVILIGFGTLVLSSCVFQAISFFMNKGLSVQKSLAVPNSFFLWLSLFFATVFAAFCEEFLYRFYIPDVGTELSDGKFPLLWEIFAVLIFAFSHFYQGAVGIFNAFFCGIILRLIFLKTKSLWCSFGVHVFYNFLVIFVEFLIQK